MGSFCHFAPMEHSGTFRHIFGHRGNRGKLRSVRGIGLVLRNGDSGCTWLHHVAWGCTRLHGFRLSKNSRLRLRESTRVELDARWSAKPRSARREKNSAPLLPPNRARFGQQSRTTPPKTPEKRAKKFRILITPFARL